MTTRHHTALRPLLTSLLALATLLVAAPTALWAIDVELAGIRVGSTPTAVTQRYGSPHAILARRSDGTVSSLVSGPLAGKAVPVAGYGAAVERPTPGYGGYGGGAGVASGLSGSTVGLNLPPEADIVRVARLGRSQVEWIYSLGKLSLGVVITGQGADAVVSDVIAASFAGGSPQVVTEKGIRLGDPLSSVISRYGFPTDGLIAFQAYPAPTGVAVEYPTTAPAGAPGAPVAPSYPGSSGVSAGGQVGVIGESIVVNLDDRTSLFTKCCIARYGEIDFTFCDMKVARIHIVD